MKDISTVTIKEIVEISKTSVSEGSKIKAYESISTSEDLIRRNWKLTYLDVSNLSAYQIQKVNESIDTFVPVRNKIELMRTLIKEGIQTFNIDRMFLSLGAIGL